MNILFQDKEVQKLLDDYQRLVGIRIAVFDTDFNELYSSPKNMSNFCACVRQNPSMDTACKYCDEKAFLLAKANKETYIYPCHLGLYEAVTPIFDNEKLLGYVMIGQMLDDQSTHDEKWHRINLLYSQYSEIFAEFRPKFDELKKMSMTDIEAVSNIMKACASSIFYQHLIEVERSPITERIDHYIESHYKEPIETKGLCDYIGVSKTTVYNYLKNEHNLSLTQYVNRYRLSKSKEILRKETLPIGEVAAAVGFDDYNYFTRLFKKTYGQTPSHYRKALRPS